MADRRSYSVQTFKKIKKLVFKTTTVARTMRSTNMTNFDFL